MRSLAEQMSFYESHHHKKMTKFTHFIGVPMIVLSLMILLGGIHVSFLMDVSVAWIAVIALLIYYCYLDIPLAIVSAVFLIPMNIVAQCITNGKMDIFSLCFFFLFFVLGWAAQLIGHRFEGNRPAFLENFFQVFVAPVFLVAEICFACGYRKELQSKIIELAARQNK